MWRSAKIILADEKYPCQHSNIRPQIEYCEKKICCFWQALNYEEKTGYCSIEGMPVELGEFEKLLAY